jgi:DNA-directed RNA polymerase subunit RPC12/RpoP
MTRCPQCRIPMVVKTATGWMDDGKMVTETVYWCGRCKARTFVRVPALTWWQRIPRWFT